MIPIGNDHAYSEVRWIVDAPELWHLEKLKWVLHRRKEKNRPVKTDNILSLSIAQGLVPHSEKEGTGGNKPKEDLTAYDIARPGDLVINSMNVIVGAVGLSQYFGVISPVYYAMYAADHKFNIEFYHYVFQSKEFQDSLAVLGNGIMVKKSDTSGKLNTIRMKISFETLGDQLLPIPSAAAQAEIVDFLDHETARIDALIEKKTRFIELLKEKRQALITQAVTKGLDPNVPMRDSGVEWIGEVPEGWGQPPSYAHFKARKGSDAATLTKEYCLTNLGKYAVYSGQTENQGVIGRIDRYEFDLHEPAILTTTVGAKAMSVGWTELQFSLSQNCMLIIPDKHCFSRFYFYFFQCLFAGFRALIPDHMQPSFRMEDFYGMRVLLPPHEEQVAIAKFLDEKLQRVDALADVTEKSIDLLKERRSALITAAVTGQIDLRAA